MLVTMTMLVVLLFHRVLMLVFSLWCSCECVNQPFEYKIAKPVNAAAIKKITTADHALSRRRSLLTFCARRLAAAGDVHLLMDF